MRKAKWYWYVLDANSKCLLMKPQLIKALSITVSNY